MGYTDLEKNAARMVELSGDGHGLKPHRLRAEKDRVQYEIQKTLRPTVHKMCMQKNMNAKLRDEIDQHASIGIIKALATWIPEKATFSTHVHWQIMAELGTLQWTEYPDRRRLNLMQPLKIVELDRPIGRDGGDEPGRTMIDEISDMDSEDQVECGARKYMAKHHFERVMSHYVGRKMASLRINGSNHKNVMKQRRDVMRNYQIYLRRVIKMDSNEIIATHYKVTRERIRQIIKTIDDSLHGQLPRSDKEGGIIEATRAAPTAIHQDWNDILLEYYMETGEDARLLDADAPLPARVEHIEPKPVITSQDTPDVEEDTKTDETHRDKPGVDMVNVVQLARKRPVQLAMKFVTAAASVAVFATAANAQSRAIPPEAPAVVQAMTDSPVAPVTNAHMRKATKRLASDVLVPTQNITDVASQKPGWGVALTRYTTIGQLRAAAPVEQRRWDWLHGLKASYDGDQARGYAIAFGPLTQDQARGLCHEAQRVAHECRVLPYGAHAKGGAA